MKKLLAIALPLLIIANAQAFAIINKNGKAETYLKQNTSSSTTTNNNASSSNNNTTSKKFTLGQLKRDKQ